MTVRVLHLADLHLDSAYGGRPGTRTVLRQATMESFDRAIALALDEELDVVVLAGDAFDEGALGHEYRSRFRAGVRRLASAGVHFIYATGNHDPGGAGSVARRLDLPGGSRALHSRIHLALDERPRQLVLERDGRPALEVCAIGHGSARVTEDLAPRLGQWSTNDLPRLCVLHTQVGGANGAGEHAAYAPSSAQSLARIDAHYWALGHVHVRGRAAPNIEAWYPGNVQGRNPKESGPKGGLLVELDAGGVASDVRFVALAGVEHRTYDLDFDGPKGCLLYTSPSPRDQRGSRMPSSA